MVLHDVLVALAVLVAVLAVLGWRRGRRRGHRPDRSAARDPYFTDGLRAVLVFERRPVSLDEVEVFEWERPGSAVSAPPPTSVRPASGT